MLDFFYTNECNSEQLDNLTLNKYNLQVRSSKKTSSYEFSWLISGINSFKPLTHEAYPNDMLYLPENTQHLHYKEQLVIVWKHNSYLLWEPNGTHKYREMQSYWMLRKEVHSYYCGLMS